MATVAPSPQPASSSAGTITIGNSPRLETIDLLRGLVMVLMALDHTRGFFSEARISPTNLDVTTPALFFTRWITHFCAPVFVFLAGTSAFLYGSRGRTRGELSRFLWTRGLWLVVLEITLVRWGWSFKFDYHAVGLQVIWALGASMIVLAALVYLPLPWITGIGVVMIIGHNAFDQVTFPDGDWRRGIWAMLHKGGAVPIAQGYSLRPAYPLVPWIGVMAAGYGFGRLFQWPAPQRRRALVRMGAGLIVLFLALRLTNLYGDPNPWSQQKNGVFTLMSILNCDKYPPSLLYLCMTLGPAMLLLAWLENPRVPKPGWLVIFGRVPMLYYLAHLYLIHFAADCIFPRQPSGQRATDHGYPLPGVYLTWIIMVALLYPLCRWYAGVKARSRSPWLSYL